MWRVIKNLLPMADNFWKRKIVHYPLYQRCGRGNKTTYRALFYCKAS